MANALGLIVAALLLSGAAAVFNICPTDLASLVLAVPLGGVAGGLTVAMTGDAKAYSIRLPSKSQETASVLFPGFLGDMFVGLMAALVLVGGVDGITSFDYFKLPDQLDGKKANVVQLWFQHFGLAFVGGFLGLKLIKRVADSIEGKIAALEEKQERVAEQVTQAQGQSAFAQGRLSLDKGLYDEAEAFFKIAYEKERGVSIRAQVALAEVARGRKQLERAIQLLDDAIASRKNETEMQERVATAFWNRACYKSLLNRPIDEILADLEEAIKIIPAFVESLMEDRDLASLKKDQKFQDFTTRIQAPKK